MIKRRGLFNWLRKNNWVYILYKKRIVLKGLCLTGAILTNIYAPNIFLSYLQKYLPRPSAKIAKSEV